MLTLSSTEHTSAQHPGRGRFATRCCWAAGELAGAAGSRRTSAGLQPHRLKPLREPGRGPRCGRPGHGINNGSATASPTGHGGVEAASGSWKPSGIWRRARLSSRPREGARFLPLQPPPHRRATGNRPARPAGGCSFATAGSPHNPAVSPSCRRRLTPSDGLEPATLPGREGQRMPASRDHRAQAKRGLGARFQESPRPPASRAAATSRACSAAAAGSVRQALARACSTRRLIEHGDLLAPVAGIARSWLISSKAPAGFSPAESVSSAITWAATPHPGVGGGFIGDQQGMVPGPWPGRSTALGDATAEFMG